MQLYILNPNYEIIAVIDEAESILWNKKYNDVGECEIYLPCSIEMLAILQDGNYVYRYDDDMFCKIERVEIQTDAENGDYLIATATDICNLLAGRIVRWQIVYKGTVAGFIEKLLTDNVIAPAQRQRKIANFTLDKSNFAELTETIEVSTVTDDLLQLIIATCKAYNYGFRVSYSISDQQLVFKLYKGKNKATTTGEEYVEFSPTYANILTSSYKEDSSNYKNLAYVGYKNTKEEFVLTSVYVGEEPEFENRREIYVDATSTSKEVTEEQLVQLYPKGLVKDTSAKNYYDRNTNVVVATYTVETDGTEKITVSNETYLLLIRSLGLTALAEHNRTQEFTGEVDTIDTYEYKQDYDLGDIVKVVNEYGIGAEAQVVEIMESDDTDNGYIITPKFEYIN